MEFRRFLAELKGRGVYRVAALYAAGSWALLQVADVFFPILGLPEWAITGVLITAAAGFPVALALAWIFEVSSSRIIEMQATGVDYGRLSLSPARVVELFLLIALVCLVGFLYLDRLSQTAPTDESASELPLADKRPSVAVMAFENISDDPSLEYFGDGLAEEILNLLSRLNEVDVAARTSSFYFKGKPVDLRDVSSKLGVGHILEGSVRRSGDRVRVTAQLIEMNNGYHIWSETFDRLYSDSFRIQDEIARQVVDKMQVLLSESSRRILNDRPTIDPQAYDFYLRGREYLRESLSQEDLESAVSLFERALALDQNYADAHAGLCDSYLEIYRLQMEMERFSEAKTSCEKALSLSPDALPVHVALGNLYRYSGRYAEAVAQFENALAINSKSFDALDGLSQTYQLQNRIELAEKTLLRAIQVKPSDWRGYMSMGGFLFQMGRFEEALPYYRRITELMPENAQAFNDLGAAYSLSGDFDQASEAFERSLTLEPTAMAYSNAGSALFLAGRYREASEMYIQATERAPEDFHWWGYLADAYKHAERMQELAEPMYRKAIRLANKRLDINPADATTMGLMAHYHASLGERAPALRYIARATNLAPADMYVHYNSATALCALGDEESAAAALAKAVEIGYLKKLIVVDANLCSLVDRPEFQPSQDTP